MDKLNENERKLVEENHNLIYFALNQKKMNVDEYYDVAAIALCKAAKSYDPSVSKFSTYAVLFISGRLFEEMRKEKRQKRVPLDKQSSIDFQVSSGPEDTLHDFIPDIKKEFEDYVLLKEVIRCAKLKEDERKYLMMYVNGYSLNDISKIYGCTNQCVSLKVISAKRKLKQELGIEKEKFITRRNRSKII